MAPLQRLKIASTGRVRSRNLFRDRDARPGGAIERDRRCPDLAADLAELNTDLVRGMVVQSEVHGIHDFERLFNRWCNMVEAMLEQIATVVPSPAPGRRWSVGAGDLGRTDWNP